jgi:type IV pilus assembly protein PilP
VLANRLKPARCIQNSLIIFISALLLVSCGSNRHIRDLQQFVANLNTSAAATVIKAKFQPPPPVTFEITSGRSPFEPSSETIKATNPGLVSLHPLQGYALTALKFKGTVIQDNITLAFLLAPDDKLYQVKLGDIIGDHYGKIIHIYPDRIEVAEQALDNTKQMTTRIVTLQRKD